MFVRLKLKSYFVDSVQVILIRMFNITAVNICSGKSAHEKAEKPPPPPPPPPPPQLNVFSSFFNLLFYGLPFYVLFSFTVKAHVETC